MEDMSEGLTMLAGGLNTVNNGLWSVIRTLEVADTINTDLLDTEDLSAVNHVVLSKLCEIQALVDELHKKAIDLEAL
ncbi:MAG: hypothetical protein E3K37_14950 [Candidatus Kuenenia sp.]|nr:hypothetical protein [Candidatus Kuenenia hertensis]